jgi:hypothetical protein
MSFSSAMADDYSVSELARIVASVVSFPEKPTDADVELVIRRLRSWTLAGALTPVGDPHSGTGKHRLYDRSAVYPAAVLNVLADNDQSIGNLLEIARLIRNLSGPVPLIAGDLQHLWAQAISGTDDVFLIISSLRHRGAKAIEQELSTKDDLRDGMQNRLGGIFVNLTSIFSRLPR